MRNISSFIYNIKKEGFMKNDSSIICQIKNMKKVLSFILVFLFIFSSLPLKTSFSQDYKFLAEINFNIGENSFYINGYKLNFDSNKNIAPIIKNGRTFIPIRSIIESIGGEVIWREKTREVEIKFNKNLIVLIIDKNSAFVNGKSKKIDNDDEIKPFILYSRTYVPLRFIIENLDGDIEYNSKDKSIVIEIDRETKEVTDSTGRKVIVPKKIYRIVSLYPMSTIMIFALKAQDRFIGTYSSSMKVMNFENIKKIFPNFEKLLDLGSFKDYNPEVLLSCKPDLIVTPHFTNIKKLEEINLPVLLLDHESPENLLKSIDILGDAIDKKEEAKKIINYYNKNKKLVEDKLKGLEKRKVYVAGETITKSYGSDFYQTFMVDIAHGESVTKNIKGGKIEISLEDLLKFDPEYIFIPSYFIGTKEDILNRKELQDVRAVKEKKVYTIPSFLISYDLPSVESILGIFWLSEKINGDILKIDFENEVRDFYKNIFGYNLSDKEIEEILKD